MKLGGLYTDFEKAVKLTLSIQHLALSGQHSAKTAYRKGREDRKGTEDSFVSSINPRVDHTHNGET